MKNIPFFSEGAYQWASEKYEQKPQKEVSLDSDKLFESLRKGQHTDFEVMLFESAFKENPLLMLRTVDPFAGQLKTVVYTVNRKSFETFKKENQEMTALFLMNGRIAYQKALHLDKASLPHFKIAT